MDKLWAPWRIKYIQAQTSKGCIFCIKPKQKKDKLNYIICRGKFVFMMLNIFPYNNGHVMIAPYRHTGEFERLTSEEKLELMDMSQETIKILKKALNPHGFNLGMNLGKSAGAGFDHHLHLHIVPRWNADTNFMPVIAQTKVISQSLDELYQILTEGK